MFLKPDVVPCRHPSLAPHLSHWLAPVNTAPLRYQYWVGLTFSTTRHSWLFQHANYSSLCQAGICLLISTLPIPSSVFSGNWNLKSNNSPALPVVTPLVPCCVSAPLDPLILIGCQEASVGRYFEERLELWHH